jgi:uncharacterized protein YndB with AHSA1/START domain
MPDIRHRVGINAPPTRIYEVLSTIDGLKGWWTRTVDGEPDLGGTLRFYFGRPEPSACMEVAELAPGRRVAWRCVGGPDEWVGTTLTFDIETTPEETAVMFTHADWREPGAFMHHCSTKWAYFLLALKAQLEGGQGTPYPDDMKISSWG